VEFGGYVFAAVDLMSSQQGLMYAFHFFSGFVEVDGEFFEVVRFEYWRFDSLDLTQFVHGVLCTCHDGFS